MNTSQPQSDQENKHTRLVPLSKGKRQEVVEGDGDPSPIVPVLKRQRLNHSIEYCDQLENAMLKKIENELELIKVEVEKAKESAKLELDKKKSMLALELSLSIASARKKLKEEGCSETEIEDLVCIPSSFSSDSDYDVSIDRYFSESKTWYTWPEFTRVLATDYPSLIYKSLEFQQKLNPFGEKVTKESLKRILKHRSLEQTIRPFRLVVGDLGHVELELCNRIGNLSSNNLYCLAIEGKHWDLVDAMINSNIQTIESLEQKLVASAKSGNVNLCRLFLEQGAKPKGIGNGELPPLFYAVQLDHTEMVSLLFNKGAKIPKHANGEQSELHIAAKKGNIAIAQMLIENGADVNAINGNTEWAPVHEAAAGGKIEMCQFLVENYNCDLDCLTATGKRAFDLARIGGHSFLGAYLKNQWEAQNALQVESTDKHFEDERDGHVVNLDNEARYNDLVVDDIRKEEKPENDHINDSQAGSMTVQESVTHQESNEEGNRIESTTSIVSGKIHPSRRILMSFDDNESEWNHVDANSEEKDHNPNDFQEPADDSRQTLSYNHKNEDIPSRDDHESHNTSMEEGQCDTSMELAPDVVSVEADSAFVNTISDADVNTISVADVSIISDNLYVDTKDGDHVDVTREIHEEENDYSTQKEINGESDIAAEDETISGVKKIEVEVYQVESIEIETMKENMNDQDQNIFESVVPVLEFVAPGSVVTSSEVNVEKTSTAIGDISNSSDVVPESAKDVVPESAKDIVPESAKDVVFESAKDVHSESAKDVHSESEDKTEVDAHDNEEYSIDIKGEGNQEITYDESEDLNSREEDHHDSDNESVSVSSGEDLYPDLPVFKCPGPY